MELLITWKWRTSGERSAGKTVVATTTGSWSPALSFTRLSMAVSWTCVCAHAKRICPFQYTHRVRFYHWRELPQVSFLLRQKYACWDQTFVATNKCLLWLKFCHDKHNFVTTVLSWQACFCCNKRRVLLWQTHVCHDKHVFVITNTCLSWPNFCRNKYDTCGNSRQS